MMDVPDDPKTNLEQMDCDELKLQKTNKLQNCLPYNDNLIRVRDSYLNNLKSNLSQVVLSQDDTFIQWIKAFNEYLNMFDLAFTKHDHVMFIKIFLQVIDSIEDDFVLIHKLVRLTNYLLKRSYLLSRDDLQIDWRILFRLMEKTYSSSYYYAKLIHLPHNLLTDAVSLVINSNVYFSKESTAEMLSDWKQYYCIYSNEFTQYIQYSSLFFPTLLPPGEHEFGFKLWFNDFFKLWISYPTSSKELQQDFVSLFSYLSCDACGFIDWDQYLPLIFQRFLKFFANNSHSNSRQIQGYTKWIVYMISPKSRCLEYLRQFFRQRSINMCMNLSNSDCFRGVITSIVDTFLNRLCQERYKKNWYKFTPNEQMLTDDDVRQFASIIVEIYEKVNLNEFDVKNLYKLSLISSEILAERVIVKLDQAYEQISEPSRLVSALQLFSISLYPILNNPKINSQYRLQIIPILNSLVSSINTNDHMLCFIQMFSIHSIVTLDIPLDDCSYLLEDNGDLVLNEFETQMLMDSRQLEDFAIQFINCCFTIIESNNEDMFKLSKGGLTMKLLLWKTLANVLKNSSIKGQKLICDKLFSYVTSHIFENEECCKIITKLIGACFSVNPEYSMERLFQVVSKNIKSIIENKNEFKEICKSELLYNLHLLNACFVIDGKVLIKYQSAIVDLLKHIFNVEFEDYFILLNQVLCNLFIYLTRTFLLNAGKSTRCFDGQKEKCSFDQFMNWPKITDVKNLQLEWHVPNEDELNFAQLLFRTFIKENLEKLEEWTENRLELTKYQLMKSLYIIVSFRGFMYSLPNFDSNSIMPSYLEEDIFAMDITDGCPMFRDQLLKLLVKMKPRLEEMPDTVDLLILLIQTVDFLLFPFDSIKLNSYFNYKSIYQPISKENRFPASIQESRAKLYNMKLVSTLKSISDSNFTDSHILAVDLLLQLSTCSCSKIRKYAQSVFEKIYRKFPNLNSLCKSIVPKLVENLRNIENYDALKGTIFILTGRFTDNMMFHSPLDQLVQLWPAVIKANFAEKSKLATTFNKSRFDIFSSLYTTIPIKRKHMSSDIKPIFQQAQFNFPSEAQVELIEKQISNENQTNEQLYNKLIHELVQTLREEKLHWLFYNFGVFCLDLLIRYDMEPNEELIDFFLDNFIHESLDIRTTSAKGLKKILYLIRPKKESLKIDFDSIKYNTLNQNYLENDQTHGSAMFHDKVHAGYYPMSYNAKRRPIETTIIKNESIRNRFCDESYLDKVVELYSVESSKSVNSYFVKIWKYLFQTYGLFNDDLIYPRIEKLLKVDKHCCDKLAIEIMIGINRAIPWFNRIEMSKFKSFLIETIFGKYFSSFNSESYDLWARFISSFFTERDLRRSLWVFEHIMFDNLFLETTSPYYQFAFVLQLLPAMENNWKFGQISKNALSLIEQNLDHPYQNVRFALGEFLAFIFFNRVEIDPAINGFSKQIIEPNRLEFIERIVQKLNQEMGPLFVNQNSQMASTMAATKSNIFDLETPNGKKLNHLIETITRWISRSVKTKTATNIEDFVLLVPYLCLVHTNNKEVNEGAEKCLTNIASQTYQLEQIEPIISILIKVANNWNWHTRKRVISFLSQFAYNNIFILSSESKHMDLILQIIVDMLEDEVLEVRSSAFVTLSTILIWNSLESKRKQLLIDQFKRKSTHKIRKILTSDGERINDQADIRIRHGGILGLCSFIYAHPDDLPDYLKEILLTLTQHQSDPQPILKSITLTLNWFKQTHQKNWLEYKQKFSSDELLELNNIISPSYYA